MMYYFYAQVLFGPPVLMQLTNMLLLSLPSDFMVLLAFHWFGWLGRRG
jgi:hypothetical protein